MIIIISEQLFAKNDLVLNDPTKVDMPTNQQTNLIFLFCRWNGSNTNNKNLEGEGTAGTDRNNILMLAEPNHMPSEEIKSFELPAFGDYTNNYPALLSNTTFLNLTKDDLIKLASSGEFFKYFHSDFSGR